MVLRVSTFKSVKDFTDYYQSGVTLKSQALKIWLKRKGYPQSFVAERLGISKNKFRRMLFKRQRFNKSEMTALIHLMGARAAIDMVWFQSLQEKKRIQKYVWEGQMSNKNNFEFSNNFETPNEAKIIYGGDEAFYRKSTDEIHLPKRDAFTDLPEFYSTAMHEIGHSTGHKTRLNRDLSVGFGTAKYAEEELRAEIASMFIEQDLGIETSEKHIENNGAYIQDWHDKIKEDPNVLFKAIADAEKICKFVMTKESLIEKEIEPYAIIEDENEYGDTVYKVRMCAEYGQTQFALSGYPFRSRDALMSEFGKMQELPFWSGKDFKEVSFDELEAESRKRAEEQEAKVERLKSIKEEPSEVFLPPSEIAAVAQEAAAVATVAAVEMSGKGIESLTRMDDRDVVDKASKTKHGDKFLALFNGEKVLATEEQNERSLMARLAMHTGENAEQLLRIFRASGQFREDKPNAYYEKMANEEMQFVATLTKPKPTATAAKSGGRFTNTKS